MPLNEIVGISLCSSSLSLLSYKVNSFDPLPTPTMICCLDTGPKSMRPIDHGLKLPMTECKIFLFISGLSLIFGIVKKN
jgi:hypothetical protein